MRIFVTFITHKQDVEASLTQQKPVGNVAEAVGYLKNGIDGKKFDRCIYLSLESATGKEVKKVAEYCKLVGIDPSQVLYLDIRKQKASQLDNLRDFSEIVHMALEQYQLEKVKPNVTIEWFLYLEKASMIFSWSFFHFALTKRPNSRLVAIKKSGGARSLGVLQGLEISPDLISMPEKVVIKAMVEKESPIPEYTLEEAMSGKVVKKDASTINAYMSAKLIATLDDGSSSPPSTLILGESGVGKEDLARYIHHCANKPILGKQKPAFFTMNCAGLGETLADSLLFGHRRGAFTGADSAHEGLIATALGGTLFLDEVAELAPVVQAKLLRVLQERKYHRLGEEGSERDCSNVRFVFATCRINEIVPGLGNVRIRRDLFERIAQYQLTLKPLRERPKELEDRIARHIALYKIKDKVAYVLPERYIQRLIETGLEGNFRELDRRFREARIRYQCSIAGGVVVEPPMLDLFVYETENALNTDIAKVSRAGDYAISISPEEVFHKHQQDSRYQFSLKDEIDKLSVRFQQAIYALTKSRAKAAKMLGYSSHNSIR